MRRRRTTFLSADPGGGDEGDGGDEAPQGAAGGDEGDGGDEEEPGEEELRFSKSAFDRRLARAARSKEKELRKALGLGDDDDLSGVAKLLESQRKAEAAKRDELEKLSGERDELKTRAEQAEARAARLEAETFVARHGRTAGLIDDPDVVDLALRSLGDFVEAEGYGDDETPDSKAMTKFFAGLKETKPFLFGSAGSRKPTTTSEDGGAPGGGKGAPGEQPVDAMSMTPLEFDAFMQKRFAGG